MRAPNLRCGIRIPSHLQESIDHGDASFRAWAGALPQHVADAVSRWGLALDAPYEPGGNCSWAAPGTDREGREVALKVAWRHTESMHEAEGLAALGGRAAARVYSYEHVTADTTVMLLERCIPGTMLFDRSESEQHEVIVGLLRTAWSVPLPPDHPFRPLAQMADEWVTGVGDTVDPIIRDGLALFVALSRPRPDDVLLMTDLHAMNVLASTREPWVIIDPKPYIGDRHYDITQHLMNCDDTRHDPLPTIQRVAAMADLDADRVRQWMHARCAVELLQKGEVRRADLVPVIRTLAG